MIYLINLLSDDQIPVNVKQYLNLSLDLEKNHALFPGKNLFISLHHGSNFILINKTMILLHKYFKINLCIISTKI
jgi:hypothetical protein